MTILQQTASGTHSASPPSQTASPTPTPPKTGTRTKPPSNKSIAAAARNYNHRKDLEHKYLKEQMPKKLQQRKLPLSVNRAELEARVLKCWDSVLTARETKKKPTLTLRTAFPDEWEEDEENEKAWVLDTFLNGPLERGSGAGEVDDDEDPMGTRDEAALAKVEWEYVSSGEVDNRFRRPLYGQVRFGSGLGHDEKAVEETCVALSLSLQLEDTPGIATKPYWGFNEKMEMVVIHPLTAKPGTGKVGDVGLAVKRTVEENEVEGSRKRMRL